MARKDKKSKQQNKGKKPQAAVVAQPAVVPLVEPKPVAGQRPSHGATIRLIPLTILLASGLLVLKTVEIWNGGERLQQALLADAIAQDDKKEEVADAEATPDAEAKPDEKADEHAAAEGDAKEGEAKEGEHGAKKEEPPAPPPVDMFESKTQPYSAREVDVLQKLSERREKLDNWEREIALREKVLEATEQRIDGKLGEMKSLNDEIQKLLVAYKSEEDAKIRSLVKIYETMKPKDAARIFDQLDMDVLLMVVDRMSERKVAPVLAGMSPEKAKEVTQQLADQQKLQKPVEDQAEKQSLELTPKF